MRSPETADEELIRGCRENSRISQEALYRRYAKAMFHLCLFYESDREKAKDILQEAFIKIFKNLEHYDRKGSLNGWMRKIIVNTAIDHCRRKDKEIEFISIEHITPPVSEYGAAVSTLNTEDIISQVNRLPEGARMIFQLHTIEGYSHREIARLLHISEGTSKSQINRAKTLLKKWISNYDLTPRIIGTKG